MKALVQRVVTANVTVNDEIISQIGHGLCVFVAIAATDTIKDMEYLAHKILKVKLFDDDSQRKWKNNVVDKQYEILCVSQFTLYNTWKGNKPDFHRAMGGDNSKDFYKQFVQLLKKEYNSDKVKDGLFGAYMQVTLQNDGPVTVEIESPANLSGKEGKGRGRGDAKETASGSSNTPRDGEEETKVWSVWQVALPDFVPVVVDFAPPATCTWAVAEEASVSSTSTQQDGYYFGAYVQIPLLYNQPVSVVYGAPAQAASQPGDRASRPGNEVSQPGNEATRAHSDETVISSTTQDDDEGTDG